MTNTISKIFDEKNSIYFILTVFALFLMQCFLPSVLYVVYPFLLVLVALSSLEVGFTYLLIASNFRAINGQACVTFYFVCVGAFLLKFLIEIIRSKRKVFNKKIYILMAILLVYMVIPIGAYNFNFWSKLMYISCLFFVLFMVASKPEIFRITKNIRWFAISLIVASLFGCLYFAFPTFQYREFLPMGENFYRFHALFDNPNILSMTCEILLGLIVYLICSNKAKWYDYVLFAVVGLIGASTMSKTFLIIAAVLLLIFVIKMFTKGKKASMTILAIMLVGVVGIFTIGRSFVLSMFDRFFGQGATSFRDFMNIITTQRYDIWITYLQFLGNNPVRLIFGSGLGASRLEGVNSTHNIYLAMVYQLGVVGTILFVWLIVEIIRDMKKNPNINFTKASLIPLIVLGLIGLIEDMIFFIVNIQYVNYIM